MVDKEKFIVILVLGGRGRVRFRENRFCLEPNKGIFEGFVREAGLYSLFFEPLVNEGEHTMLLEGGVEEEEEEFRVFF